MDDQCCIYCGLVILGYGWVLQVRPGWPIDTKESSEYEYVLPRFAIAKKFVSAMAFVGAASVTASPRGAATLALSRRSAEKLSWRRETSNEGVHQASFYPFLESKNDALIS
jgi:hypothetical protein